jgi:NADPH:quinone reductase-like Zn-dependent oxidoreductase
MQSIVQSKYGDDPEEVLQIGDVPAPTAGEEEVLVRVHAASVDRGTWHVMTGLPYLVRFAGFGVRRPKAPNPGRSFAGTVESTGAGVSTLAPGDDVYGTTDGSFAELAVAPADQVARKPGNLAFEQAAAVPVSAVAALQAVRDKAKVVAGERVLVVGASGGVGGFAVQLAKAFGAKVTGVSSTAGIDVVRSIGADHVIDYTNDDFANREHEFDVVIDTGGHRKLSDLRRALAPRGRLVIVGSETGGRVTGGFGRSIRAGLLSLFVGQKLMMLASSENANDLDTLGELIEAGRVVVPVERTYPLRETADAIRRVQGGRARGKVVIAV